jgi:glutathione S-transferase
MIRPLTEGVPRFEERAVRVAYPIFAGLLRLLLRLTEERAKNALEQAKTVFAAVDARLEDGRRFLVGDRLSLSDLAFAVAAAPFVLPDNYGGPLPAFSEMPPVVQSAITDMRAHRAGLFATEIYREFRGGSVR